MMKILVIVATLFVIGSMIGWIIEVLFRRFFSAKKWINPGFLVGPYIPLYGFGVLILYGVSQIPLDTFITIPILEHIIKILIIGVGMTLIELIAGIIFIKGMGIKLWDYSNRWGNFKGIICPLFSFIWLVIGALYFYFINPFLVKGISWISENIIYCFFIGIVCGMMLVDFAYSIHLGLKIKKLKGINLIINKYDEFKSSLKETFKNENGKRRTFNEIITISKNDINEKISEFNEKHKPNKWWKKNKKD